MRCAIAVVLLGLLTGCPPCIPNGSNCIFECATTRDCRSGQVCVHEHAHDGNLDTCESPCAYNDAGHPNFRCPDSPAGTACRTDDDQPFCPPR